MKDLIIYIINNSQVSSKDMSGGEKIAMELVRRWRLKTSIYLCSSNLGIKIWNKYQVKVKKRLISQVKDPSSIYNYPLRVLVSLAKVNRFEIIRPEDSLVYSASDFWPDVLPALWLKMRYPQIKWIAGFYLFAPRPWQKDSPYKGKRWLLGLFYWLSQQPIYWLVKHWADLVFVTSQPDVNKFITRKRAKNRVLVIRGGVDLKAVRAVRAPKVKKYEAVFIGRLHPQKGALELIDIWQKVVSKKPQARLAMIGDGPLRKNLKLKIKNEKLENNIDLLGFVDGIAKIKVFKSARVVVHPAIYDSGGMAAAEAMACGLPGVSFDLLALKTYYPQGMLKTPCFNQSLFAANIIKLLNQKEVYRDYQQAALGWAKKWDWDKKAEILLKKIKQELLIEKS